jgi:hypothetical protein
MDDRERILKSFREALEREQQIAQGKATLLAPHIALAKCWHWIHNRGATGSAETLQAVLLNLASEGAKALPNIRALDGDRRIWVASLIIGINELSKDELLRAAGREEEA